MKLNILPHKRLLVIASLGIIICYLVLWLPQTVRERFVVEDGVFESLTAVSFFITSIGFFIAYFRAGSEANRPTQPLLKRLSYLVLGLIFLFGAGEEISWGQRIIGIETPEAWREINAQEETNLHNLEIFHQDDFDLFNTDRLFALFWGTLMVGIPALAFISPTLKNRLNGLVPIFPWTLGLLFIFNYLLAKVVKNLSIPAVTISNEFVSIPQSIIEIKESVYSFLFLIVVLYLLKVMLPTTATKL